MEDFNVSHLKNAYPRRTVVKIKCSVKIFESVHASSWPLQRSIDYMSRILSEGLFGEIIGPLLHFFQNLLYGFNTKLPHDFRCDQSLQNQTHVIIRAIQIFLW